MVYYWYKVEDLGGSKCKYRCVDIVETTILN